MIVDCSGQAGEERGERERSGVWRVMGPSEVSG